MVNVDNVLEIPISKQCKPRSTASELDLQCLHVFPNQISGLKRVEVSGYSSKGRLSYLEIIISRSVSSFSKSKEFALFCSQKANSFLFE